MLKLPIVGVMGSGTDRHESLATPLGAFLAKLGVHLLTGGGRGVMEAVSKSFAELDGRKGSVLGVIPCKNINSPSLPREGYPNPYIEIPIYTHLPLSGSEGLDTLSRNHINVLSSDAIIALPGGEGTLSEIKLAQKYKKPIVGFGTVGAMGLDVARSLAEIHEFLEEHLSQ